MHDSDGTGAPADGGDDPGDPGAGPDGYRPVLPPEVCDALRREWLAALEATAGQEAGSPIPSR